MNEVEKRIRDEAQANDLDVDDLGNLTVAMLRENFDDPIGGLIFRSQIKNETEKLNKVANEIFKSVVEEYEREAKKRNENKTS